MRREAHVRLYVQRAVMLKAQPVRWICPGQPLLWRWDVQHNSEALQECEERVGGSVSAGFRPEWSGSRDGLFLESGVGVLVDVGGLGTRVAFSGVASVHHRRGRGGVGVAQVCATAVLGVGVRAMAVC